MKTSMSSRKKKVVSRKKGKNGGERVKKPERKFSYEELQKALAARLKTQETHVFMTFEDIEQVLSRQLPESARKHRAWWGNSTKGHPHAKAWMDADLKVEYVKDEAVLFVPA